MRAFLLGEAAVDEFNKGSSLQAFEEEVRLASTSSRERGVLLDKSVTALHDFIDAGPESQHGSSLAAVQAPSNAWASLASGLNAQVFGAAAG